MQFSDKYGYTKIKEIIQIDSMDDHLRNSLWSILCIFIWDKLTHRNAYNRLPNISNRTYEIEYRFFTSLWIYYFKKPIDEMPLNWENLKPIIKSHFYNCNWYDVYNFIEFTANKYDSLNFKEHYIEACNNMLQKEVSAYRFIDDSIARITDKNEIKEVEDALNSTPNTVQTHLKLALIHLSSRDNPDYRNSIKESISAVEGLARKISGNEKATLGTLLSTLEKSYEIHPALTKAYSSLYGYTSDEAGIRHALSEKETITFDDAKYFLVICSSFINYVTAKIALK